MMKAFMYSKNYCMVCYKINDCSYIFVLLKSTVFNLTYFSYAGHIEMFDDI